MKLFVQPDSIYIYFLSRRERGDGGVDLKGGIISENDALLEYLDS